MKAWLSDIVLSWSPYLDGWSTRASQKARRPYSHWEHARGLSKSDTNEFERIDIITTLKRSVELRIRNLNDIYQFRRIPYVKKGKSIIEILSQLEIVKPMMIAKLNRIRNTIEHQNKAPPSHEECVELVDFTWYFLRSTDILIQQIPGGVVYDPTDGLYNTLYSVNFYAAPDKEWLIKVSGWVENHLISSDEKPNSLIIDIQKLRSAETIFKENKELQNYHKNKNLSDISFAGKFIGPPEMLHKFLLHYFRAR